MEKEIIRQVAEVIVLEKSNAIMAEIDMKAIAILVQAEIVNRMASRIRFDGEKI